MKQVSKKLREVKALIKKTRVAAKRSDLKRSDVE